MTPKRIAVITPVGPDQRYLTQSVQSVANQTHKPYLHILVFDGSTPFTQYDETSVISLPLCCNDSGATPRAVGVNYALAQHCDGLAFLDADNVWLPDHLSLLISATLDADVAIAKRIICDQELNPLKVESDESDGAEFADTNVILLTGRALHVAPLWGSVSRIEGKQTCMVDRTFWKRLLAYEVSLKVSNQKTVLYRSRWKGHYKLEPDRKPAQTKRIVIIGQTPTVYWDGGD